MTNQYKTLSHRNEVLIALRWQAAILQLTIAFSTKCCKCDGHHNASFSCRKGYRYMTRLTAVLLLYAMLEYTYKVLLQ